MIISLSITFRFMLRSFFLEDSCYFCALFVICFAKPAPSSGLMISFAAELKQGSEKWLPTLSIKMMFCGKHFFSISTCNFFLGLVHYHGTETETETEAETETEGVIWRFSDLVT